MKLNRLEAHDRLLHLKKEQAINIFQGAEDCLKKNPLSLSLQAHSPYIYLFAHPRTADDGVTKVMYWQPRLTKPKAQTNSYLFRALSGSDVVETIWFLPPSELWKQFESGKMLNAEHITMSIYNFRMHRERLEMPHPEDFSEDRIRDIYRKITNQAGAPLTLDI